MEDERRHDEHQTPETPGGAGGPSGPQSPAPPSSPPGLQAPAGPQAPQQPPAGPQASTGPQAPAGQPPPAYGHPSAPEQPGGVPPLPPPQAPAYGGPVPPGGWQQPVVPPPPATPLYTGRLASWGSRLGAWFLDGLVILGIVIVVGLLIAGLFAADQTAGIVGAVVFGLAGLAAVFCYAPLLMAREGAHNGQTWGKQAVSIRVVRTDGQRVSGGFAALREIVLKGIAVSVASSIIPIIPWFLNYFWPLWDDENRALHDMAVDTRVVMA